MNPSTPRPVSPSHASEKSDTDYSREELLKLLVYFEGELQLKEREIETLKVTALFCLFYDSLSNF